MTISDTEFSELKEAVHGLQKAINGNGEEGLNSRVSVIEAVVGRIESRLNDLIFENREYRKSREKNERIIQNHPNKKNWFMEKVLPTVLSTVISSIMMILLFIIVASFSPIIDQMIAHALK